MVFVYQKFVAAAAFDTFPSTAKAWAPLNPIGVAYGFPFQASEPRSILACTGTSARGRWQVGHKFWRLLASASSLPHVRSGESVQSAPRLCPMVQASSAVWQHSCSCCWSAIVGTRRALVIVPGAAGAVVLGCFFLGFRPVGCFLFCLLS